MKTTHASKMLLLAVAGMFSVLPGRAQDVDRSQPPAAGKPKGLSLPAVERFRLANGVEVVMMEKHAVPLVVVEVTLRTGAIADPKGKEGLANLTADMLTEGAGTRSSLELADAVDYLGADLNTVAGFHTTGVSIHVPAARLDSALAILADVVRRPKFPQAELDRKKKELLTEFTQWRDEPRMLASLAFNKTVYGDRHPYGRSRMGNRASVSGVTVADMQKFHGSYFVPGNATIIVAGDVNRQAIAPKLEKLFGTWKGKGAALPDPPAITQIPAGTLVLIDKPGAPQSVITIGRVGVARTNPDYFAITVMNTLLGGSFTSRLNQNLREKHGYTYGAGSRFDFRPLAGPFAASASVQTEVTDKALTEFMNELNAIVTEVTDDEVSRAKNVVALGYPSDFQTVGQLAMQLGELSLYGLPSDYFNSYVGKVLGVTKEDVLRVAKKYIDPKNLAIIVVGDKATIDEGVKALELAPAKELTVDELLGSAQESDGTK
jgi:zinc protease